MTELFNTKPQTVQRRKLRKNMPKGEQLLWHHLKNKQLGYKFRRQFGIGPYVADFYCPRLRLCIEVDGLSHADKDAQTHDTCRDAYMKSLGITVKRYVGGQVWHELDRVKQDIYNTCIQLEQRVPTSNKPPLASSFVRRGIKKGTVLLYNAERLCFYGQPPLPLLSKEGNQYDVLPLGKGELEGVERSTKNALYQGVFL